MKLSVGIFGLFFLLVSCTNQGDSKLESKIEQLDKELKTLKEKQDSLVNFFAQQRWVALPTDSQSYLIIKSESDIVFTISVKKIEPYIDGFKVSLQIGNLTATNFQGLNFKVSHTNDPINVHLQGLDFQEQSSAKLFPSGTWTSFDVILRSVNTSQFKYIIISDLRTNVVSMR